MRIGDITIMCVGSLYDKSKLMSPVQTDVELVLQPSGKRLSNLFRGWPTCGFPELGRAEHDCSGTHLRQHALLC